MENLDATLEDYVEKSSDVRLLSWWGTYKESKEEYEDALHYFKRANDILSQVRVLCSMHKTDRDFIVNNFAKREMIFQKNGWACKICESEVKFEHKFQMITHWHEKHSQEKHKSCG